MTSDSVSTKHDERCEKGVSTLLDYIEESEALEREAGEVLKYKFDKCTYSQGYVNQPVYACLTCTPGEYGGFCYSCSIMCHSDHEVLELHVKRHFRCDCGCEYMPGSCSLTDKKLFALNEENKYGHNFRGEYCWCNSVYDPEEAGTMFQCVMCQDWFHDRCINAISKLPQPESFDEFICHSCVAAFPVLLCYVGSKFTKTAPQPDDESLLFIKTPSKDLNNDIRCSKKRLAPLSHDSSGNSAKKKSKLDIFPQSPSTPQAMNCQSEDVENSSTAQTLPNIDNLNSPVDILPCKKKDFIDITEPTNLFCVEGWRESFCRCAECRKTFISLGIDYLFEEEKVIEFEKDEEADRSLYTTGLTALCRIDRVKALEGIRIVDEFGEKLKVFLKGFVERGEVVGKEDVERFFAAMKKERTETRN